MNGTTRNILLGVVAVGLFGFAGWRLFFRSSGEIRLPEEIGSPVVCLECGESSEVVHSLRERGPYACPVCGAEAAQRWYYCYDCHYRFVPALVDRGDGKPRPTPFPTCPHCHCTEVGAFDPKSPVQTPVADAKLPEWPP